MFLHKHSKGYHFDSCMTEAQLIKSSKKNNRQAQTGLYELYSRYWFSICLRYLKDRNDASDVLQEAIIKIFTKLIQFDKTKGEGV